MTELLIEHKKPQRWHPLGFFYSVLGRWLKPKADYHLFVSVQPFADIVGKIRFALLVSKHYFVILLLSHPFWQQKGGVLLGFNNFFLGFRYGRCNQLLHLQMVRRKRQ